MTTLFAWSSYQYDLKGRLTETENSEELFKEFLYNVRSEVRSASIGDTTYTYTYDTIGNRLSDSIGSVTQTYVPNSLNQISTRGQETFTYDTDGNLLSDGTFSYTYDCENRLLTAAPMNLQYGSLRVSSRCDYKHRRVQKIVETYNNGWQPLRTHTFLYEGWNLVLELVQHSDNTTTTIEYFWGNDLSGSEQGAGGVGGLVAVSINGAYYFPYYDHNGNITDYVSESGTFVSRVTYTPFGTQAITASIPAHLNLHFSTKYLDRETGLCYYGRRFYEPTAGRWLNRDPIEEIGGENLYVLCENDPIIRTDYLGLYRMITGALAYRPGDIKWEGFSRARDIIRLINRLNTMSDHVGRKCYDAKIVDLVLTPLSDVKMDVDTNPDDTYIIAHGGLKVNEKTYNYDHYYWNRKDSVVEGFVIRCDGVLTPLSSFGDKLNSKNIFGCYISPRVRKVRRKDYFGRESMLDTYSAMYNALYERLIRYLRVKKCRCVKRVRIYEGEIGTGIILSTEEAFQKYPLQPKRYYGDIEDETELL